MVNDDTLLLFCGVKVASQMASFKMQTVGWCLRKMLCLDHCSLLMSRTILKSLLLEVLEESSKAKVVDSLSLANILPDHQEGPMSPILMLICSHMIQLKILFTKKPSPGDRGFVGNIRRGAITIPCIAIHDEWSIAWLKKAACTCPCRWYKGWYDVGRTDK